MAEVPAVDATTAERLARSLETLRQQYEHAIDEAELLLEARARYPRLLSQPPAPLAALLAAQDLVSTPAGVLTTTEAEDDDPDGVEQLSEHLHDDHGLDEEQVEAVLYVLLDVTRIQHAALQAGVAEARQRLEQGEDLDTAPVTSTERTAARSALDELELLRAWAQVRGQLYELVEQPRGSAGSLLDLRTGERTTVVDHSLTGQLEIGTAVLAWLVEGPEATIPFYGGVVVPDAHRQHLLDLLDEEPPATQLARWVRDLHAPPRLATTDGDPMVSIERVYDVPDPETAHAALSGHLEQHDDGSWSAFEERDARRWSKGSVELVDGRLTVATMSAPRAAWFADLIAEVVPDATLVDEQRLPVTDLLARDGADAELPDDDVLDGLSEQERAARLRDLLGLR